MARTRNKNDEEEAIRFFHSTFIVSSFIKCPIYDLQ